MGDAIRRDHPSAAHPARRALAAGVMALCLAGPASAEGPLSAIDWLSDSVTEAATRRTTPPPRPRQQDEEAVARSALPEIVTVTPLEHEVADAVGLRPAAAVGLPGDLWSGSGSADLRPLLARDMSRALPALQDLWQTLLTTEFEPPAGSDGDSLFVARLDALLALGALDPAQDMAARVHRPGAAIMRRWFDAAILTGRENGVCDKLRRRPDLTPTYSARIFCLARGGDWRAAALTLETAEALSVVSTAEDALLARFLDAEIASDQLALPPPRHPSPLDFAIYEAIGEPIPTSTLPVAFAHADLRPIAGWKARVAAAERLARSGAIPPERLFSVWTERRPAASGSPWDRVFAVQGLIDALDLDPENAERTARIAEALPDAWAAALDADLAVPFADLIAPRLPDFDSDVPDAQQLALRIALLSDDYEAAAADPGIADLPQGPVLAAFAEGRAPDADALKGATGPAASIAQGFAVEGMPDRFQPLAADGRRGEALLRAIDTMEAGHAGDQIAIRDGIAGLRALGAENTARRAALELMILGTGQ
ncbi:hypothetical protein EKE94_02235 [Mesobaculum littorinae]|uniref:Uncharacterized protein n=1 Tax=Mesobaculum littorinae TaxID=2486419 RepID=A0A438AL19_9RHOB|nr:hypothetical protein [Mesobaculum littorinae]RVV99521.1 hypothetical protein EKE94_02235 [Mesobaculum littorinae]